MKVLFLRFQHAYHHWMRPIWISSFIFVYTPMSVSIWDNKKAYGSLEYLKE